MVSLGRLLVAGAALGAVAIAAHTAVNLRVLRRPDSHAWQVDESVDILIPARDEEATIAATVESALAQESVPRLRVTVLDDGSSDGTGEILAAIAARDSRLVVLSTDDDPPPGWLGKPWACARLGTQTSGSVLVFVDADVILEPHAVRALVDELRSADLDMVAPYPRQLSSGTLQRLVQPLVTWAWVATMPVGLAERSHRPSLSAANGQLIAFDALAYAEIGGHGAVHGEVIEDVALMRELKVNGYRCATVDGSHLATCRMYSTDRALIDGYAKSLWSAFGGPVGSIGVGSMLAFVYLVPPAAMALGRSRQVRAWGMAGYLAGCASRAMVARRTGEKVVPDAFAQPASIAAFLYLNAVSWTRHRRGTNTWKGRAVTSS